MDVARPRRPRLHEVREELPDAALLLEEPPHRQERVSGPVELWRLPSE